MQATLEDVLDRLFVYPNNPLTRGRQVFTREMGVLAAKRLLSSEGPRSPLELCDSRNWQVEPFRHEVHVVLGFSTSSFNVAIQLYFIIIY